jgi:hypothetical protein
MMTTKLFTDTQPGKCVLLGLTEVHSRSRSVRARASAITAVAHGSFCRSRASGSLCGYRCLLRGAAAHVESHTGVWRCPKSGRSPPRCHEPIGTRSIPFVEFSAADSSSRSVCDAEYRRGLQLLCTACSCRLQRASCFYQLELQQVFVGRPLFSLTDRHPLKAQKLRNRASIYHHG